MREGPGGGFWGGGVSGRASLVEEGREHVLSNGLCDRGFFLR